MEVILFGGFVPTDEGIAGFDRPGRGAPSETGYRPILYKGDVFEMIPYDLQVTEIVMLLDQAVVKGLKRGITNQFEYNGWEVRELIL